MPATLLSHIRLDKLSVVLYVSSEQERKDIEQNLWLCQQCGEGVYQPVPHKKGGYQTQLYLNISSAPAARVLLQVHPYVTSRPFFRVELNPDRLDAEGLEELKIHFESLLPFGYAQLCAYGRVSRADFAVDIYGVHIEEIVPRPRRPRTCQSIIGQDGRLQTICFGSSKGNQLAVYDKFEEQKSKNMICHYSKITRIEMRRRMNHPMAELPQLPNPFSGTSILDLSTPNPPEPVYALRLFRDSCRVRGIKAALKLLPQPLRSSYEKFIQDATTGWWDPEALWKGWPGSLDDLGLLTLPTSDLDLDTMKAIMSQQFLGP